MGSGVICSLCVSHCVYSTCEIMCYVRSCEILILCVCVGL